jgi:hypothetical protein
VGTGRPVRGCFIDKDERLSASENREKLLDSGCILREEPTGFPKELGVVCE